jgi:hypothetical protein
LTDGNQAEQAEQLRKWGLNPDGSIASQRTWPEASDVDSPTRPQSADPSSVEDSEAAGH